MNIYKFLLDTLEREYDTLTILKENARSQVYVMRHRQSGTRYVFRRFEGNCEVYKQLLRVSSPHLPQIYEVGELDSQVAVLEEYVQGDTLAFLLEGGTLNINDAKSILKQLCSAVWILHSREAVHRDIKPENVIIRGNEAVLIDFDASRLYKGDQSSDTQVLGTTGYAAPEQYGITQTDGRADIFALGVLLNIMLTGKHPAKELAPGRMGRIVQKCTMTNPQKRYKNVLRLMEAL